MPKETKLDSHKKTKNRLKRKKENNEKWKFSVPFCNYRGYLSFISNSWPTVRTIAKFAQKRRVVR